MSGESCREVPRHQWASARALPLEPASTLMARPRSSRRSSVVCLSLSPPQSPSQLLTPL